MKIRIRNVEEAMQYPDDELDLIFECTNCGKQSDDEEIFVTCVACGSYICSTKKCCRYVQHQGYEECFCKKCRRNIWLILVIDVIIIMF